MIKTERTTYSSDGRTAPLQTLCGAIPSSGGVCFMAVRAYSPFASVSHGCTTNTVEFPYYTTVQEALGGECVNVSTCIFYWVGSFILLLVSGFLVLWSLKVVSLQNPCPKIAIKLSGRDSQFP